jgi:hypothetical protein
MENKGWAEGGSSLEQVPETCPHRAEYRQVSRSNGREMEQGEREPVGRGGEGVEGGKGRYRNRNAFSSWDKRLQSDPLDLFPSLMEKEQAR